MHRAWRRFYTESMGAEAERRKPMKRQEMSKEWLRQALVPRHAPAQHAPGSARLCQMRIALTMGYTTWNRMSPSTDWLLLTASIYTSPVCLRVAANPTPKTSPFRECSQVRRPICCFGGFQRVPISRFCLTGVFNGVD